MKLNLGSSIYGKLEMFVGIVDKYWSRRGIRVCLIRLWPGVPHKKGCMPLPSQRCLHQSMLQYCHWNGTSGLHGWHMLYNVQSQPWKEKSNIKETKESHKDLWNHIINLLNIDNLIRYPSKSWTIEKLQGIYSH